MSSSTSTGKITSTLKGPIWAIFCEMIPEFRGFDGERFYDVVMENSELLYACLILFRRFRARFGSVVRDARGRVVNDDFVKLPCGRTIHDIIGLIVRAHAKTHFGQVLKSDPGNPATAAGGLYRAIRDYLIHDWQTRLVPAYAGLSVSTVNKLGPALLEARDVASLNALVEHGDQAVGGATAQPMPKKAVWLADGASRVNVVPPPPLPAAPSQGWTAPLSELFWNVANESSVAAAIGSRPGDEVRDLVAIVGNVGSVARQDLRTPLQFDDSQLFVCLVRALEVLGKATFTHVFGEPGDPHVVAALAARMGDLGIAGGSSLQEVSDATGAILRVDERTGLVILPG